MRKLTFHCQDGNVKLSVDAVTEELEEHLIGMCYNVFQRAIVGKDKNRTAARFQRAISKDSRCKAAESSGTMRINISID